MAPAATENDGEAVKLARIEARLETIERDLTGIKSIFRWFAVTVGGAIVLAFMNFILNGGLKMAGGG